MHTPTRALVEHALAGGKVAPEDVGRCRTALRRRAEHLERMKVADVARALMAADPTLRPGKARERAKQLVLAGKA